MKAKIVSDTEQLLTDGKGLAARYYVAIRTIQQWQAEGRIPFIKLGRRCVRYPIAECDEIILRRKIKVAR